jgi:hypothetical protein
VRNSQKYTSFSLGRSQLKRVVLGLTFICSANAATAEIDCQAVVAATLDELALGATAEWTATASDNAEDSQGEPEGEETGGLKFKPMTGSPTQKPYERARSVDN